MVTMVEVPCKPSSSPDGGNTYFPIRMDVRLQILLS